jgi:hypothetical protein
MIEGIKDHLTFHVLLFCPNKEGGFFFVGCAVIGVYLDVPIL